MLVEPSGLLFYCRFLGIASCPSGNNDECTGELSYGHNRRSNYRHFGPEEWSRKLVRVFLNFYHFDTARYPDDRKRKSCLYISFNVCFHFKTPFIGLTNIWRIHHGFCAQVNVTFITQLTFERQTESKERIIRCSPSPQWLYPLQAPDSPSSSSPPSDTALTAERQVTEG